MGIHDFSFYGDKKDFWNTGRGSRSLLGIWRTSSILHQAKCVDCTDVMKYSSNLLQWRWENHYTMFLRSVNAYTATVALPQETPSLQRTVFSALFYEHSRTILNPYMPKRQTYNKVYSL